MDSYIRARMMKVIGSCTLIVKDLFQNIQIKFDLSPMKKM